MHYRGLQSFKYESAFTPSPWLSLVRVRPRRASLRFTKLCKIKFFVSTPEPMPRKSQGMGCAKKGAYVQRVRYPPTLLWQSGAELSHCVGDGDVIDEA